jgi:hypothetical protein
MSFVKVEGEDAGEDPENGVQPTTQCELSCRTLRVVVDLPSQQILWHEEEECGTDRRSRS